MAESARKRWVKEWSNSDDCRVLENGLRVVSSRADGGSSDTQEGEGVEEGLLREDLTLVSIKDGETFQRRLLSRPAALSSLNLKRVVCLSTVLLVTWVLSISRCCDAHKARVDVNLKSDCTKRRCFGCRLDQSQSQVWRVVLCAIALLVQALGRAAMA